MSEKAPGKNKPLLIIIVVAVLTIAVPYLMYFTGIGVPAATTNEGILVQEPVVLSEFRFHTADGEPWELAEQPPRFRLVFPVEGACDELCLKNLYLARQVDTRLADQSEQLDRIYVQLGAEPDEEFLQMLATEYPEMTYLRGDLDEWHRALADKPELQADLSGHEYYLLHRYGALSMAYDQQHSGNQLLDDLEFLIRTSN